MRGKTYLASASSKWRKYNKVRKAGGPVRQPFTRIYSAAVLPVFLRQFGTVFVKPDNGYGGTDVIRLRKHKGFVIVTHRSSHRRFAEMPSVNKWLRGIRGRRRFIIQQGINLRPLGERTVDIRTIIQRNRQGVWAVTGMFAKVAKRGKAVTNVKAGGTVIPVGRYLEGIGLGSNRKVVIKEKLVTSSIRLSKALERYHSNSMYALDLGLDQNLQLWLIEVNTHPDLSVLKKINPSMYLRSLSYRKS